MKNQLFLLFFALFSLGSQAQSTWYPIATGHSNQLNTISFANDQVGYIGGNDSLLLKTTDGGRSWTAISYTGITNKGNIVQLDFVNEWVGYMAIEPYMGVYKTMDGGLSWSPVADLSGNLCYPYALFFMDENNGFIGGSGCFQGELIDKMTNGSCAPANLNWMTFDAARMLVAIDFADDQLLGLAVSHSGYAFRTTDGGAQWDSVFVSPYPLTSVAFLNADTVYAGYNANGSGFGLLVSTDGGQTWAEDFTSATFFYPAFWSVHVSAAAKIYSGASPSNMPGGLIFEHDPHLPFVSWDYMQVAQPIRALDSYGQDIVFGVGDSGLVVVNTDLTLLSQRTIATAASTRSIFPNPANNEVSILGTVLPERLELYTLDGKRIREWQPQSPQFSVRDLNDGSYILRAQTPEGWQSSLLRVQH